MLNTSIPPQLIAPKHHPFTAALIYNSVSRSLSSSEGHSACNERHVINTAFTIRTKERMILSALDVVTRLDMHMRDRERFGFSRALCPR